MLLHGRAHVLVDGAMRRELLPGDAFGEIAVLHRVPRSATVVVVVEATVLSVGGDDVRTALRDNGDGPIAAILS